MTPLELLDKMCELYWDGCDTAAGEVREQLEVAIARLEKERDEAVYWQQYHMGNAKDLSEKLMKLQGPAPKPD